MIPYSPPSFLEDCFILSKRIEGKKTWKSRDGKRLYQWDSQHGEEKKLIVLKTEYILDPLIKSQVEQLNQQ